MAFENEQRVALHLLEAIENGSQSISSIAHLVDEADPALVYLVITWLRQRYANHPAAEGVIGRIVELTNGTSSTKAKMREGKADAIASWFEEEYAFKDFDSSAFIALIVEKLEG